MLETWQYVLGPGQWWEMIISIPSLRYLHRSAEKGEKTRASPGLGSSVSMKFHSNREYVYANLRPVATNTALVVLGSHRYERRPPMRSHQPRWGPITRGLGDTRHESSHRTDAKATV